MAGLLSGVDAGAGEDAAGFGVCFLATLLPLGTSITFDENPAGDCPAGESAPRAISGFSMERAKGIEPSYEAWEASALPLSYARANI